MSTPSHETLKSVVEIAFVADAVIAVLILLFIWALHSAGWSLRDAMSEAVLGGSADKPEEIRLLASSSRLTAMIGTILFTLLGAHSIGLVIGSLSVGLTPDIGWSTNLFLAIGGFFAPYTANKVATAFAGGSRTAFVGDWKVLPPGGLESIRRTDFELEDPTAAVIVRKP